MKYAYVENEKFIANTKKMDIVHKANVIIAQYEQMGIKLSLRQLYYQLVGRNWIANKDTEYKKLGELMKDARLCGLVDWEAIEDRNRILRSLNHWQSPESILAAVASQYREDKWATQPYRVEVWVEKDALLSVIEQPCNEFQVPYLSCRGYNSITAQWEGAMRAKAFKRNNQKTYIIHIGDHDPSGIDMSRDIQERLAVFGVKVEFMRIALNFDQIQRYNLPPNPTKLSDTRADEYIKKHGNQSWELDALDPLVLRQLIRDEILSVREDDLWEEAVEQETHRKQILQQIQANFDDIVNYLN